MADKKVTVAVETTADTTALKETSNELGQVVDSQGRVVESSESLRSTIDNLDNVSDKSKESLHELVDQLDELKESAGLATSKTDKLAGKESKLGAESKKTARSLDKINKELLEAKKRLNSAATGTKEFRKAQERVNTLSKEYSRTMPRAAKSSRNFGLAALEASRGIEDLQYGIHGAVNNIPQLVMMLGGSAGLTAVISLLAIGLSQVSKGFAKANKEIEFSAEVLEGAEERKRAALESSGKALEDYREGLALSKHEAELEKETIDAVTKSLGQQSKRRLELAKAQIDLKVLEIESDDSGKYKNAEEKAAAIAKLERDKLALIRQQGVDSLAISKRGAEKERERLRNESKSLELRKKTIEENKIELKQLEEKLEMQKSILAFSETNLVDTAKKFDNRAGEGFSEPDLADFSGDNQIAEFAGALNKHGSQKGYEDAPWAKNAVGRAEKLWEILGKISIRQDKINKSESRKKILEEKIDKASSIDAEIRKIERLRTANFRLRKELKEQIKLKQQLNKLSSKKDFIESKKEIGKKTATKVGGELPKLKNLTNEESELYGYTQYDKDLSAKRTARAAGQVAKIIGDNDVSEQKFAPLIASLKTMKASMANSNTQGLTLINQLIATVKMQQGQMKSMSKQVEGIQRQINAGGVGK